MNPELQEINRKLDMLMEVGAKRWKLTLGFWAFCVTTDIVLAVLPYVIPHH